VRPFGIICWSLGTFRRSFCADCILFDDVPLLSDSLLDSKLGSNDNLSAKQRRQQVVSQQGKRKLSVSQMSSMGNKHNPSSLDGSLGSSSESLSMS
jgi:hypothetical protein